MDKIQQMWHQGGPAVMTTILATLIISLVIIAERIFRYWIQFDIANSSGFMSNIQKMVMNNSIENAIRLCRKARPKLLPHVLAQGLMRANDSTEEISNAMDHAILETLPKVTSRLPFLGTTANVATLLGLMGTLFGLMKSFAAAANATGAQKQTLLAEGIAEALIATSFGLGTALLILLAYGILMLKQTAIVDDINANASRLMDLLYTRKMKIRGSQD
jgi:biopolymer transport protein ExbB/TolQ